MLRSLKDMVGFKIAATDGDVGEAEDFYFDDHAWTVRYVVVNTGGWLAPNRDTLISPAALGAADWEKRTFRVPLSKEAVENSPPISAHRPVSRQEESQLADHFGWPLYWENPWGGVCEPMADATAIRDSLQLRAAKQKEKPDTEQDPHLRSMNEVAGYRIEADDGGIGHVEDFLVDDEHWIIRYLEVGTRKWLAGKRVLVAPEWVTGVDWEASQVRVRLTRDAIRECPDYDPAKAVTREYEALIHDHYELPKYWAVRK